MTDLNEFQRQLKSFAETVNAFKSEAVQIRVIDALLGELGMESSVAADTELKPRKARTKKTKATQIDAEKFLISGCLRHDLPAARRRFF